MSGHSVIPFRLAMKGLRMANLFSKADSLLVPILADDENYRCLATLMGRMQAVDVYKALIYHLDVTERSALHHLAEQFHIMGNEGWLFAKDDLQKRHLIRRAIELHRYKGTPWAVKESIKQFGYYSIVDDWYIYGGDPYYFRVDIELRNQTWDQEVGDIVYGLIGQWKNVRSHLEKLRVFQIVEGDLKIGATCVDGEEIRLLPDIETEIEAWVKPVFMHNISVMAESLSVYPRSHSLSHVDTEDSFYIGAALYDADTVTVYPAN